jgi:beta-mannosidase
MVTHELIPVGPVLMTTGPWKPIYLETYATRIAEVDIRSIITDTQDVKADVFVSVSGQSDGIIAKIKLLKPDGSLTVVDAPSLDVQSGSGTLSFWIAKEGYELWYPVGYGPQPLYTFEVTILDNVSYLFPC